MDSINFGILTVSDTSYQSKDLDKSGPEIERLITDDKDKIGCSFHVSLCERTIVPDDEMMISEKLISWCDDNILDVILTIGGTGFSKRDVTPEATRKVIEKEAPGMALAMLSTSLNITPMAMLSRAVCGIRNKTLIINLPGSPKAARECLGALVSVIPHAVDLIKNNKRKIKDTHGILENKGTSCSHHCTNKPSLSLEKITERLRESPYPMISVEKALEILWELAEQRESELISIESAYARVLDADLYSKHDLPPFRASIKDGYAVLASDGQGRRKVLSGIKAGSMATSVKIVPGTCVRVNTGAPIPDDTTAVVQVEDTVLIEGTSDQREEKEIDIRSEVKHGQDIRPIGCDIKKGELILKSRTKLGAPELGLLAACGYEEVSVVKLPSIGVISTGDELQCTGQPLMPGHVYDSNKITLISILKEHGFQALDMGIAQDNEDHMVQKIKLALEQVDVVITSGSVSMGDGDMLKPILQHHFNASIHFGRVNMKPGKPTTFVTCSFQGRRKYFLCLPGNPVSATVTMHLFALPLLKRLCGDLSKPIIVKTKLTTSYVLDPRPEYARVILKWDDTEVLPKAYSTGNQISSKLLSCKNSNALLMLPGRTAERPVLNAGETVQAMLLGLAEYI